MNNSRIQIFLDELLSSYQQTPELLEQKEELLSHLTERVQDNMAKGLTYDQAFDATIRDLGDVKALLTDIAPVQTALLPHTAHQAEYDTGKQNRKRVRKTIARLAIPLVALSPFIYLILGAAFGWWAWAWVIVPIAGIMTTGDWRVMISGLTPFIYFLLGWFFGWWAWGWLIIPISGVLFTIGD